MLAFLNNKNATIIRNITYLFLTKGFSVEKKQHKKLLFNVLLLKATIVFCNFIFEKLWSSNLRGSKIRNKKIY